MLACADISGATGCTSDCPCPRASQCENGQGISASESQPAQKLQVRCSCPLGHEHWSWCPGGMLHEDHMSTSASQNEASSTSVLDGTTYDHFVHLRDASLIVPLNKICPRGELQCLMRLGNCGIRVCRAPAGQAARQGRYGV